MLQVSVIVLISRVHRSSIDLHKSRVFTGSLVYRSGPVIFLSVDIWHHPIGTWGATVKTNKLAMVSGGIVGVCRRVPRHDLYILAGRYTVTAGLLPKSTLVIALPVGIGLLLAFGFTRIAYGIPIHVALTVITSVLLMGLFLSPSAGHIRRGRRRYGRVTCAFITGAATVYRPAEIRASEEDSFGLWYYRHRHGDYRDADEHPVEGAASQKMLPENLICRTPADLHLMKGCSADYAGRWPLCFPYCFILLCSRTLLSASTCFDPSSRGMAYIYGLVCF